MALLAPCSELVPDWLNPSHADDLWTKFDRFDFENERTLVLPNPSPTSDSQLAAFLEMGAAVGFASSLHHPTNTLPTPPHSPPTEHDLDDLVASIPEILESTSTTPPSAFSEILSDLAGMEASSSPPRMGGSWGGADWWGSSPVTPFHVLEASIKTDIMWGGGGGGGGEACTTTAANTPTTVTTTPSTPTTTTAHFKNLPPTTGITTTPLVEVKVEVKKERLDSESSTEVSYVIHTDDTSDDSDDDLPYTPSCTDSDCDDADPTWPPPHHMQVSPTTTTTSTTVRPTPLVNNEHNYCGRVPDHHHHRHHIIHHPHHTTGTITPSDTEDEVDVVSCPDQDTTTATTTTPTPRLNLPPPTPNTTNTTTPTKNSIDVKRQLQLAIQEAVRNRQNRTIAANNNTTTTTATTTTGATECGSGGDVTAARLVSVKIKTQGKPAAYTKRMRDYHSEVVKSTKHRRRNKGENDEGRRSVHNSLERQRRVDLRSAFEYLRQLVPDTKILEKAPKVQILKKAAMHCKGLQHSEQRLLREKEELRRQVEELKKRKALSS